MSASRGATAAVVMVTAKSSGGAPVQVVMLAMYNLSLEGTGRQGYFRWKEDICAFICRHWNFLLGTRSVSWSAHSQLHALCVCQFPVLGLTV